MDIETLVDSYVETNTHRLVEIVRDLVRLPSENTPPCGAEGACQEYLAGALNRLGWDVELYRPDEVPGVTAHPLYWRGRDYTGRPNLGARRKGAGGGRSLVLSGHIDTVPRGSDPWTRNPFGGEVEGNRLYGRGAYDMKSGVATNLFVAQALADLGLRLAGDLTIEAVVDEEFGGVNGTLAGRLAGYNADAAVISEPTTLRICPAQRGGRTVNITFCGSGGIMGLARPGAGAIDQLGCFLAALKEFAARRRASAPAHDLYRHSQDPVPVSVNKVFTAPWGFREPATVPETCRVELFWQAMPGEGLEDIDRQFFTWFEDMVAAAPDVFAVKPRIEHPIRWLPGSAIAPNESLVAELSAAVETALGAAPPVQGMEAPCDMYVFHGAGIPAVLWGASGANAHNPDEYVEIDSIAAAAKALLLFVCRWCGTAR